MRFLAISCLVLPLSCGGEPSVLDPNEDAILAVANPGEIVLTSRTDAPIGYLIQAQSSIESLRWPPCYSTVAVSISDVLAPRAELHVPAAQISGYQAGDSAVVYYKVVRRDSSITSAEFYTCLREGKIILTLR